LVDCELSHWNCRLDKVEQWLPSRLVYVGGIGGCPRIVESSTLQPPIDYTTLSHCWGTGPTVKLTKSLIDDFRQAIPEETMPRTYADAITITREIGVEHIWIDSLCIIQDSTDDWHKECQEMANVYKNGYCNIAAMSAVDSDGGCFSRRDPGLLKPVLVQSYWAGFKNGLWNWKFQRHLRHIYDEIESSPLHMRGWVLQERLLSPRNLHFGEHMIYWECRQSVASENSIPRDPNSKPLIFSGESKINMIPDDGYLGKWQKSVEQYTAASLTYPTDKLVAISALAREMQQIFEHGTDFNCKYLAGLWSPYLAQQLLWYPTHPSKIKQRRNDTPSWTWASLDGPVH
ncbi:HET-domain-containing protein, partial [Zopfia rhizophila CBS 207.26]